MRVLSENTIDTHQYWLPGAQNLPQSRYGERKSRTTWVGCSDEGIRATQCPSIPDERGCTKLDPGSVDIALLIFTAL